MILAASVALGFLTTLVGLPYARRYLALSGILGTDQQKPEKPKIPTSGGVAVLFGFLVSVTSYLGLSSFMAPQGVNVALILAALSSVVIISLIGLLDDIHVNLKVIVEEELEVGTEGTRLDLREKVETVEPPHQRIWKRFTGENGENELRQGLGQMTKMLFVLPAALPLIAVGAGSWSMTFPLIGTVNWGLMYPLVLLPLGLLFVSNVVNMLAGTNGLSASTSLVASTSLGVFGYLNGSTEAALIAFSLSGALLAFLYYNFYPASVLPGDSLTYLAGAAIFSATVIGNMERFAVFIFTPWIIEFFLKARSGFNARSWGDLQEDGRLEPPYDRNYSLTHPLMRRGFSEPEITLALAGMETLICVTGLILFTGGVI
ncbi:MAG: hypothetical protein ABEI07_01740 [Candidatus Nanohaloarchaea archaeon]